VYSEQRRRWRQEVTGSLLAGRLLGTLLADLIFLAIGTRLWKGLRRART